jgi:8-oxo-dGTP diphosphatase
VSKVATRRKQAKPRQAAKLIVINDAGHVLLFRHARKTGGHFWSPPGGRVEAGETFERAAEREAREELGITNVDLRVLWKETAVFEHAEGLVRQTDHVFLVVSYAGTLLAGVDATHTREGISDARFWSRAELKHSSEPVFPDDLLARLATIANLPPSRAR